MADDAEKYRKELEAEKRLRELFRARTKDRRQAQTRRRKAIQAGPEKLEGILESFFEHDPLATSRLEEAKAIMAWPKYVGDVAARQSRVLRVRNHQMVVAVADPLWMQQLSWLKGDLIKKYRADFPRLGIRDMFFTRES